MSKCHTSQQPFNCGVDSGNGNHTSDDNNNSNNNKRASTANEAVLAMFDNLLLLSLVFVTCKVEVHPSMHD